LPVTTATLDHGWEVRFETPLEIERTGELRADVTEFSRLMAERFERAIAARPTDWHMFQPGWDDRGAPAMPEAIAGSSAEATTAEQR
jgi:lauroyl/myristoyl acyltransferase